MASDKAPQKVANLHDIAERFSLPAHWIKAEAKAGRLPALIVGRRFLFNAEAVERALLDRASKPNGGAASE